MTTFLYDVQTRIVEASGSFVVPTPATGKAVIVLNAPVVMPRSKLVNQHPNPTTLLDNPAFGQKLGVTLDGTTGLDFDGIPYAPANGQAQVILRVQKLDRNSQPVSGAESVRIIAQGGFPISADGVTLVNGQAQVMVGPTAAKGDCALEFVDPAKILPTVPIRFRWR